MGSWSELSEDLCRITAIFGLKLWYLIAIVVAVSIAILIVLISLCLSSRRRRTSPATVSVAGGAVPLKVHLQDATPAVSKRVDEPFYADDVRIDVIKGEERQWPWPATPAAMGTRSGDMSTGTPSSAGGGAPAADVAHFGWGRWYTLRELCEATGGFANENVIGEGGFGKVYRGVLDNGSEVAIKDLMKSNEDEVEKEFKVEVEAIGRVRHKNLVRLLGYCVEGTHRMLVYEYLSNGTLDYWLHEDVGKVSPLTWDIRMNIILGTAKGLAYLHEGLEPKVVHRDVKSSNILLDQHWNPKVSDFGLAKLLGSGRTYVTTRVMGTFGYVAPEYVGTGMLTERSDVYSFGILIMEIITGRTPIDRSRPLGEVNLVDWLKVMVGDRKTDLVLDPRMPDKPSPKVLKRTILAALHCIDPDAKERPTMGHVIRMLEMDGMILRNAGS